MSPRHFLLVEVRVQVIWTKSSKCWELGDVEMGVRKGDLVIMRTSILSLV